MTDEALLTLRQLALELEIPESTVRYYRDAYLDHIPSVGTGRRRRYPREAAQVLRTIANSYGAGRSRAEIVAAIHHHGGTSPGAVVRTTTEPPQRAVPLEDVTNLDLLAAILDGEREQRDALWQMAKEIVRLTDVLAGQDKVISDIADQAGVKLQPPKTQPALQSPQSQQSPIATPEPTPPPPPPPAFVAAPPAPRFEEPPVVHAIVEPLPRFSGSPDVERLKAELESERALVERLRESKLQLEHRAADAEAALEDRKGRRPSVIRRILGTPGPEQ